VDLDAPTNASYIARCTIAKARELRAGPVCSPFPVVWLTRLASSATSFQYKIGSSISPLQFRFPANMTGADEFPMNS